MRIRFSRAVALVLALAALATAACGSKPGEDTLRDSFAQQLASNRFLKDFERNGDEMTFTAEGTESPEAKWRVHIDSATIEENNSETQPFKGTVKSSWFSDGQQVTPKGGSSNLPIGLQSNGLSQDCWAFWEADQEAWSWE